MIIGAFSAGLIALAAFAIWLAVRLVSDNNRKWLFLWVPIILLAAASTFFTIDAVMGLPSKNLPASFTLLSYTRTGNTLYVWGIEKGEKAPRTWVLPYSQKRHEELEKGMEAIKKGNRAEVTGADQQGTFMTHSFRPLEGVLPKKGVEE